MSGDLRAVPPHVWRYQGERGHALGCCVHGPIIDAEGAMLVTEETLAALEAIHHPSHDPSQPEDVCLSCELPDGYQTWPCQTGAILRHLREGT
jgi:hypothetical protein